MLSTITSIGVVVFILSCVAFVVRRVQRSWDAANEAADKKPRATILPRVSKSAVGTAALLGLFMTAFGQMFFYAEPGMSYLVQYPRGEQVGVLTPGLHLRWAGEVLPFKKFVTIGFLSEEEEAAKRADGVTFSAVVVPQRVTFNDSVTSHVSMTARFELPNDEAHFLALAVSYRQQENLMHASLIPIMQESMNNAARMFSAQDYISGRGGDFDNAVLDQTRHGIYLLDVSDDANFSEAPEHISVENRTVNQGQTIRYAVSIRLGNDNLPLRKDAGEHPLVRFNIGLLQANIKNLEHDPAFRTNLNRQREAAAQVAIERQNARMEEERKRRIIAQGEADKAATTVELEQAQIRIVIAGETQVRLAEQEQSQRQTTAETLRLEAEIAQQQMAIELGTARLEAQRILVLAEAEAARRTLILEADNALQMRLNAFVTVSQAYAEALAHHRLTPTVVIAGGDGGTGNATDLISLLTAQTAKELGLSLDADEAGDE